MLSAILLPFVKLPFVIKFFVLSIFEWPFHTGFTVWQMPLLNVHADISNKAGGLNFGLSFYLHPF